MSSLPPFEFPKRLSLPAQTATAIRKAVSDGIWQECLPGERHLCNILQVSRPTVRTALQMLAKEGLFEIRQGLRNRLLSPPPRSVRRLSRLVGLVTQEPVSHLSLSASRGISEMRTHLAEHGFAVEVLVSPPRNARAQRQKLEEFVRQNRVFCCALLSVSKDVQAWFSENSFPCLVIGTCHPDVKLPSLDVDYRSVCRHAAGILLGKGHRRLALVMPDSRTAGHLASEQGFREAVAQRSNQDGARATIVRHNGTAQGINAKLNVLFRSGSAPTALLVAKSQHVFIVVIYLLKRGLAVPDTLSLIARDHDPLFEIVIPPIAHYAFADETFAQRLSRLMLQMVNQGYLSPVPSLIFPKYFAGGTVKRLSQ